MLFAVCKAYLANRGGGFGNGVVCVTMMLGGYEEGLGSVGGCVSCY